MSSFVYFRGVKVAYTCKGKGRAVVLVHGFLGAKEIWKEYSSRLSKHFKVITIDLLGHGESECQGYLHNMELLAESVKTVLNELGVRKSVLVGHSLGGYVCLAYAELYPDAVLGMVLMNSSAKGDTKERQKSRDQLIQLVRKNRKRALELLVPSFFALKKRNTHWSIKKYLRLAHNCSKRGIIATVEGMKARKEREIILKFAPFPYVYFIGLKDTIFDSKILQKEAQLSEKGSWVIFENSSHMILFEEVEKTFKLLKMFAGKLGIEEKR